MRARRSVEFSRLLVVVLALASGCSADEGAVVVVAPAPAPPDVANPPPRPPLGLPREAGPAPSAGGRSAFGVNVPPIDAGDIGAVPTRVLPRLVYQCSDEVTFAVRTVGDRLEVFPPGVSKSYVVLTRAGVHFTAPNAYFRADGDPATLQIGKERYVDCVSNPAAAVWGTVQPIGAR